MTTTIYTFTWLIALFLFGEPLITYEHKETSFGNLTEGRTANLSFKVTNSGNAPLIIYSVNGSCGCTATAFPPFPIKPNESENIAIKFMSRGKKGALEMHVLVTSNSPTSPDTLRIKGRVIPR